MAWLEKTLPDGQWVAVVEARGRALWERTGKRGNAGRVKLVSEHATEEEARVAAHAHVARFQRDGYVMLHESTGIDARQPGNEKPVYDTRLKVGDLDRALRLRAAETSIATVADVLDCFGQVMAAPRTFRPQGFLCEFGWEQLFLGVIVNEPGGDREGLSEGEGLIAVGYDCDFDSSPDAEGTHELFDARDEPWSVFVRALQEHPAWQSVSARACTRVEVEEYEA